MALVGLTAAEWGLLVVAIGPAVLAVVVVWLVWRSAKRSDSDESR